MRNLLKGINTETLNRDLLKGIKTLEKPLERNKHS